MGQDIDEKIPVLVRQEKLDSGQVFELEFLGRALKVIEIQTKYRGQNSRAALSNRLQNWRSIRDNPEVLTVVIDTTTHLRTDKSSRPTALGEILRAADDLQRDPRNWSVLIAAARAVGETEDLDSLGILIEIASSTEKFLNLRVEAVRSMGKLGQFQRQHSDDKAVSDILDELDKLFPDGRQPKDEVVFDVAHAAFRAFAQLTDAKNAAQHARRLFPLLLYEGMAEPAVQGIQEILIGWPDSAAPIVRSYLHWWSQHQPLPVGFRRYADDAIVGFGDGPNTEDHAKIIKAAKAVAAALTTAETSLPQLEAAHSRDLRKRLTRHD